MYSQLIIQRKGGGEDSTEGLVEDEFLLKKDINITLVQAR
jgi:hypothetical protein